MLQYKAVARVFAEQRVYRVIAAMTFIVFAACSTAAVLLLHGPYLTALVLLGGLSCLIAVYQLSCIAVGMYIAKSYLTLHPVSVGYSGAHTHACAQWLTTTLEEHEYMEIYVIQHFMVAIVLVVLAFNVTAYSCVVGVACCAIVHIVVTRCEPWILGQRLQGGIGARVGQMWRVLYVSVVCARTARG